MSSRSFRLETRSRARDEIKRIMQTVEKVRKWYAGLLLMRSRWALIRMVYIYIYTPSCREKKWVDLGLSNSLKVYKWVPGESLIMLYINVYP